jgi:flagellar assembly protein FliH
MNETEVAAPQEDGQASFQETPYEDATWEIVGELSETLEFEPLHFDVVGHEVAVDPMFADYGGRAEGENAQRWHLPEGVAYEGGAGFSKQQEEEEEPEDLVKMREEELEALKQQIFEEGEQAGLEAAIEQNNQRLATLEQQFGQLLPDIQQQLRERITQIEKQTVDFALSISKKLVGEAVEINPEYIVQILRDALEQGGAATVKKIRISPQDMEFIEIVGLNKEFDPEGDWTWEADETIKAGCIVETSAGEIDFQVDKAWERIQERIMKIVK